MWYIGYGLVWCDMVWQSTEYGRLEKVRGSREGEEVKLRRTCIESSVEVVE